MSASLAPVREVWAHRARARSRGEQLYLVYAALMTVLVVGVPAMVSAGRALAREDVLPLLLRADALEAAAASALLAAAALVGVGALRGPALLPPFFTATLAGGPLPRGLVLRRPFARALLLPVLLAVMTAGLVAATLLAADRTGADGAARLVLAGLGVGLLWGCAWSAGQLLGPTGRRLLVLALGAAGTAVAARLAGGGRLGEVLAGGVGPDTAGAMWQGPSAAWVLGLVAAGVLGTALCTALLGRLRGVDLAAQAARWETATTSATTMDLAGAAGTYRAAPAAARRLGAIGPGPLVLVYARRDAVAWLRTPDRSAAGVLGVLLGAGVLGGAVLLQGPAAWAALLLGTLVLRTGAGAFVDGLRHAVHTLGAPPLLGQRAGVQMLLHAVAPVLLLVVLAASGGLAVALLGGDDGAAVGGAAPVLLPVGMAVVVLAARAWESAKGTMPLSLATPIPTPQGDLSVLAMLAWQADSVVVPLLGAVVLGLMLPMGPALALAAAAALCGALVLLTRGRLTALQD